MVQMSAIDPDGSNEAVTYMLTAGARDNFIINTTSGEITVAKGAGLDRDVSPKYKVSIYGNSHYRPISVKQIHGLASILF